MFYDTFGIHEKGTPAKKITFREAKENVDKVCSEVQRKVASVKERFNLSREINDPTTQVENLRAVSHFKHETFSLTLNYAKDFGICTTSCLLSANRIFLCGV